MKKSILLVMLLPAIALAKPFVVSDPSDQEITHCGVLLDAEPQYDVPVASDGTGKFCKIDMSAVSIGKHSIAATFVNNDPVWGRLESVPSAPLDFERPANPTEPVNIRIQ